MCGRYYIDEETAAELERIVRNLNARAETAMEKPMFRNCVAYDRCMIPASGFYEWNREKTKFTFQNESRTTMYLAGVCREEEGKKHFVILTTAANESMKAVHDRMPLILEQSSVNDWILEKEKSQEILNKVPGPLLKHSKMEQMRLEI